MSASGISRVQGNRIFNEAIENKWAEQRLFYAHSTPYAAAMTGADCGTFADGRWYVSKNIQEMRDGLEFTVKTSKGSHPSKNAR